MRRITGSSGGSDAVTRLRGEAAAASRSISSVGGARGGILHLIEVELDGPGQQAALERAHVTAAQPQRDDDRHKGQPGGHAEEGRGRKRSRRHEQKDLDHGGAGHVAEPHDAHVHQRLGRPLLLRGQRREQQLIAGAVEAVAEDGLRSPERRGARQPRYGQGAETAQADTGGEQRDRAREPQSLQGEATPHRLYGHGEHRHARVEHGKEAEQPLPIAERAGGPRLEHVVDEDFPHRHEQHQGHETPEVRHADNGLQPRDSRGRDVGRARHATARVGPLAGASGSQ
jgi:hypothetical protein